MTPTLPVTLKAAAWTTSLLGALIVMIDPTITVALIVAIPPSLLGIGSLILQYHNHNKLQEIKIDVNSNFSRLMSEKDKQRDTIVQQTTQLTDMTQRLARAEGRREGVETKEEPKAPSAPSTDAMKTKD